MAICPLIVLLKKNVLRSACTLQCLCPLAPHLVICFLFPKEGKGVAEGVRDWVKHPFIMLMWPRPLGLMLNLATLRDRSKMRRSQVGPFNRFKLEEISTSFPIDSWLIGLIRQWSYSRTFSEAAFEPKSADLKAGATKLSGLVVI